MLNLENSEKRKGGRGESSLSANFLKGKQVCRSCRLQIAGIKSLWPQPVVPWPLGRLWHRVEVIDNLLPLTSRVTLDKSFNLSVLHFPHLQNRINDACSTSLTEWY